MHVRHLAATACVIVVPVASTNAQDMGAVVREHFQQQTSSQQQTLHNDARDFHDLSGAGLAKVIAAYRKATDLHRQNALQIAEQARTNPLPPGSGARIRDALDADLTLWYNSVPVSKRDWDAMRKQWLVPVASLSDQQWAQQRAGWFTARDAWLDKRLQDAQLGRR